MGFTVGCVWLPEALLTCSSERGKFATGFQASAAKALLQVLLIVVSVTGWHGVTLPGFASDLAQGLLGEGVLKTFISTTDGGCLHWPRMGTSSLMRPSMGSAKVTLSM